MRRLAVIEEILNIEPIAGADRIEVATIKGWKAVVGKGQHTIGEAKALMAQRGIAVRQ